MGKLTRRSDLGLSTFEDLSPNLLKAEALLNYLEFISAGERMHCCYGPERLKYA